MNLFIVGAGIGGLAAAACIQHRTNGRLRPLLFERAPELKEVGAALSLWPNATRILANLGLLAKLADHACLAPEGTLRDSTGRILRTMQIAFPPDGGAPALFTLRADLLSLLLAAVPPHSLRLNKPVTAIEHEGPRFRLRFADGALSDPADALIAADGIHSALRHQLLQDGSPTYRGYIAWRGVAPVNANHTVAETWGRGARFGLIPLGCNRTGWWAAANDPSPEQTLQQTPLEWKRTLFARFGHWHTPIPGVIEATPDGTLLCNMITDRLTPAFACTGPVTLLGDAAHPTTPNLGQGACLALEDAAVLAHALDAIPDIPTAFRVYEATRRQRTSRIVLDSRKFGRIGQWKNPLLCAFRNLMIRTGPAARLHKIFHELWSYDAWNAPLVMPR